MVQMGELMSLLCYGSINRQVRWKHLHCSHLDLIKKNSFTASEKGSGMYMLHDQNITYSWCCSGSGKLLQFGQGCDPPFLLLSYLLLGSHCLGAVKGRRRRRVRSCCTAVLGTHPTQAEEVLLLLFLLMPSCDHAQSGLHYFSDRLTERLLCDLFLLPVTIMKWK